MKRKAMERCPICREWKIPRYDQATRKMDCEHVCPKPEFEDLRLAELRSAPRTEGK